MIKTNAGHVMVPTNDGFMSEYSYAVSEGYSGTEDQYVQEMAKMPVTINDLGQKKAEIKYIDINISSNNTIQVNSASGGKIAWTNFLGAIVINSNLIAAIPYTYSNLIYVKLKNVDTMQPVSAGNYTLRCFYKA